MGCTSSTPNMVAANPNATDKISEYSEDETEQSIKEDDDNIISPKEENGKNENKVLPSCDNLADPIQLDSNSKSMIDTNLEEDLNSCNKVIESVNENVPKIDSDVEENRSEEKLSSMEDVVEKVVELFAIDNSVNNTETSHEHTGQADSIENVKEERDPPEQLQDAVDTPPDEAKEEVLEEATSPSQSTSSRATRWEALADIAAELPPSHTVDPVTGQIYALSK